MNSKYPGGSGDLAWALAVSIVNILNLTDFCTARICMCVLCTGRCISVSMHVYVYVHVPICI